MTDTPIKHTDPRKNSSTPKSRGQASAGEIRPIDPKNLEYKSRPLTIEIPDELQTFQPSNEVCQKRTFVTPKIEGKSFLPPNFQRAIAQFHIKEFAQKYFEQRVSKSIFHRTQVSIDSLISYTNKPITSPLLKSLPPKMKKPALECFQCILHYAEGHYEAVGNIVTLLINHPELRDEVYFQLIKQTSNCPDRVHLIMNWNMFLIVATIFPSTRNSETWIKSHLAQNSRSSDNHIANLAEFTYIRFDARCACGVIPEKMLDLPHLLEIPLHPKMNPQIFGTSLNELMWAQFRKHPNLPIPTFLHYITDAFIKNGALQHQGIFRLSGNSVTVGNIIDHINSGDFSIMDSSDLDDLSSVFKQWIRDLPDRIIPMSHMSALYEAYDKHNWIEVASSLPTYHQFTLAYIVGFLQQIIRSEATKMDIKSISSIFAPNIVQQKATAHSESSLINISKALITDLLAKWDVSSLYPLSQDMY